MLAVSRRGRCNAVEAQRLAEDVADRHARVERGVGVLEHHLHAPAQRPDLRTATPARCPGRAKMTRARGRLVDARYHARKRRFAATRLADEADGLALRDVEIDAVDRVHDLALARRSRRAAAGNASPHCAVASMRSPRLITVPAS